MLHHEEKANSGYNPLSWLLLCLQVEGPDVGRTSRACLVHRTLVHVLSLHLVHRYGLDEYHRHGGSQVLQLRLLNETSTCVPSSPLHEQTVDVCPLSRGAAEILAVLFGHIALEAHFVQRPLVLASHGLHDGSEERLRVEEASQPDATW